MTSDWRRVVDRIARRACAEGRRQLLETEGMELARLLGIESPHACLVGEASEVDGLDLDAFPGERVVLKVVSPAISHKSDVGGVAIVAKDAVRIRATLEAMRDRLADQPVAGFLVVEFVEHDLSFGGELLLGLGWTSDFGPIVTLGPGGADAEFLARNLRRGRDAAIFSPTLGDSSHLDRGLDAAAISKAATGRRRGSAERPTREALRSLLERVLSFASEVMPDPLLELEINPLVWTRRGPMALDALARLGGPRPAVLPYRPLRKMENLLRPRSIGIVGVSQTVNPGRVILRNILLEGFPAESVSVVKPGVAEIEGCRCHPDLASLPEPVDLLVVCVDAAGTADVVEEAVARQAAESLILIAGGLGERAGSEVHERRVGDAIRGARHSAWGGPIVNGGNCLGIRSVPGRYDTLFIPRHKLRFPDGSPAPLAVVSQSGAFGVARASRIASLGPRTLITLGNQVDLTVGDCLVHLKEDPEIEVFACYVEGFKEGDGRRWLEATRDIVASGRHVLLYRAGRTEAGQSASASHTASIAGDYAVTRALATAAGAVVADTIEDFDDLLRLFCLLRDREVRGLRLGAVSNAGFECVAIGDHAAPFELVPFGEETRRRLGDLLGRRRLQTVVGVKNPLDVTPILDDAAFAEAARLVLRDENADTGLVGCVPLSGALRTVAAGEGHAEDVTSADGIVSRLARLFDDSTRPWVAVVDGGPIFDPMARQLEARGVPTFRTVDRALRLFARYCEAQLPPGRP